MPAGRIRRRAARALSIACALALGRDGVTRARRRRAMGTAWRRNRRRFSWRFRRTRPTRCFAATTGASREADAASDAARDRCVRRAKETRRRGFTVASANRARRGRCSRWRRKRRACRARRDGSTRGRGRRRANRVRWGRLARRLGTRSGARRAERGRRGRARWRIITKRRRARGERRRRGMDRRSIRR